MTGTPCSTEGCVKPVLYRGLCRYHYRLPQRHTFDNAEYQRRYRKTEGGKQANRAKNKKRRAKTQGAAVAEMVVPKVVHDRDGWRCHLCHRKVSPRRHWPDPLSASLDHIVPLSVGGEHTYTNVATAHLQCNMSKHNRAADDQLRIIG